MRKNTSILPKVAISHPVIALKAMRNFLSILKTRAIDKPHYNGSTKELGLVSFRITPLCNLRCVMCGQRGETGIFKQMDLNKESQKILGLDEYKKLLSDIFARKEPLLYFWGGEPLLYPHIFELARFVTSGGHVFTINTNGTLLAKNAEQIVRDKWVGIFVSLDGFEHTNNQIRGEGSYQKVVEGLKAIQEEKKRQNSNLPYVGVVSVVSKLNYLELEQHVTALKDYGLSWHIINLGTYFNNTIGNKHTAFMREKFDVEAKCWKGFANGYNEGIDGEKFIEILARVQKINNGYPIITVPVIKAEKIDQYYKDLEFVVRSNCICPWIYSNIDYNGDVHFCADYPDYVIGNVREQNFWDIYNNEKAMKFRQVLAGTEQGIMPGCIRCYQNMLLGKREA
jgi:radical SAM protein with 4Fe4S-binding SPASM domain